MILGVCRTDTTPVPKGLVVRFDTNQSSTPPPDAKWWPIIYDVQTAYTLSRDYHDKIAGYEISNEPNLARYGNKTPTEMATLYEACRKAIRVHDQRRVVVSGGLADASNWSIYAKRFLHICTPDVVGIHPYNSALSVDRLREMTRQPVAVTEFGVGSEGLNQAQRGAIMLARTRSLYKRKPMALIAYSWNDPAFLLSGTAAGKAFLKEAHFH